MSKRKVAKKTTKKKAVKKVKGARLTQVTRKAKRAVRPAPTKKLPVKKKRPAKKKVSRALVVRSPEAVPVSTALVPTVGLAVGQPVAEDRMVALGHVQFTKTERAIIVREADPEKVSILPTGAPYLPHYELTRWLNEAFGPTGWNLSLLGNPHHDKEESTVYGRYCMFIRGVPVADAVGQQEYHTKNPRQSYGDAIEAASASGLRRCCKRLGIGLELWDKRWASKFKREHCVLVSVVAKRWDRDTKGYKQYDAEWWRRNDDDPFPEEKVAKRPEAYARKPKGADTRPVTIDQAARMWVIAKKAGRTETEIKMWLTVDYELKSSKDIERKDYDEIIRKIEAPGSLVPSDVDVKTGEIVERDPGEEG